MAVIPKGERVTYGIMATILLGMLVPLIVGLPLPPPATTPDERQQVTIVATPVVDAIMQFYKDTGAPPATLAQLVPKYLPQVPKPLPGITSGKDYLYAVEPQMWYLGIPLRGEHNGFLTYSYKFEKTGSWMYFPGTIR